jgi:alanine dehydrogenase
LPTLFLDQKATRQLLDMTDVIRVVEQAFKDWGAGKGSMPVKSYIALEKGDFRAMPAVLPGAAGVKWVNVHPGNRALGLPTVMAILIYNDPETGYPLAVMDATDITAYRTGATAAIASKYLARKDSHTLGVIGAGRQAQTQIQAHAQLFKLESIRVYDQSHEAIQRLIEFFPQYPLRECTLQETAASDILCTLTPSRQPYLKLAWLRPGTHINAIGADAEGKEELEPAVLKQAVVVVDDVRQTSAAGEINVPVTKKLFSVDEIYASLADIIGGKKPGRTKNDAITVFDSTGLAIEDIAVAKYLYEKAKSLGKYPSTDFIGV